MDNKEKTTRDLKAWLQRTIQLETEDLDSVIKCFIDIIKNHGFKIKKQADQENGISDRYFEHDPGCWQQNAN